MVHRTGVGKVGHDSADLQFNYSVFAQISVHTSEATFAAGGKGEGKRDSKLSIDGESSVECNSITSPVLCAPQSDSC